MLTYAEAERLHARGRGGRKKLENNTYLHRVGDSYAVRLHSTDVVTIHPDGTYTLDSGGWRTPTTKDRISRYSPVVVCQGRCVWYVCKPRDWSNRVPFRDGMRAASDGSIVDATGSDKPVPLRLKSDGRSIMALTPEQAAARRKAAAKLSRMVDAYTKRLDASDVMVDTEDESQGGCPYCETYAFGDEGVPEESLTRHVIGHLSDRGIDAAFLLFVAQRSRLKDRAKFAASEISFYLRHNLKGKGKLRPKFVAELSKAT